MQVLLSVRAVGLNFRDVLNVLGMYPGDPGEPGGDVAGIVAAVGSAVRHLHMCACCFHLGFYGCTPCTHP